MPFTAREDVGRPNILDPVEGLIKPLQEAYDESLLLPLPRFYVLNLSLISSGFSRRELFCLLYQDLLLGFDLVSLHLEIGLSALLKLIIGLLLTLFCFKRRILLCQKRHHSLLIGFCLSLVFVAIN